jgi:hypothetical protein
MNFSLESVILYRHGFCSMKNFFLFLILSVLTPTLVWAGPTNICDLLDLESCTGVTKQSRRSSSQSLPSPSTAANLNPAAVSFDRGLGMEFIAQPRNKLDFNIATGTGKVGGALISSSLENGFFGNRVVELDQVYFDRNHNKKQYESKKFSLALGGKLIGKNNYGLDGGFILKRHSVIKRVNPGVGLSARLGVFSLGASIYQDDFMLFAEDSPNYMATLGYGGVFKSPTDTYQEKFIVQTYSGGVKIGELSLDLGVIKTKYKLYNDPSTFSLYSASYVFRQFLFNVAMRNEVSTGPKFKGGTLVADKGQQTFYGGVQISLGKHLIMGVAYNYFLLREVTLNSTIFF